jgi:putative transposase
MPKRGHAEEQIVFALKPVENGAVARDVCRKLGITEQTFNPWKRKYENMGVSELRELRQLRDENARLRRLVSDLSLDEHILHEVRAKRA